MASNLFNSPLFAGPSSGHGHHAMFGHATHAMAGASAQQHAKLVEQAKKWVGLTFFGTMMKQMRQSPFRSKLMDGGRGGQAFGDMYDQELAQRMGRGAGSKLINSVVKGIEHPHPRKAAYAKEAYSAQTPTSAARSITGALAARG